MCYGKAEKLKFSNFNTNTMLQLSVSPVIQEEIEDDAEYQGNTSDVKFEMFVILFVSKFLHFTQQRYVDFAKNNLEIQTAIENFKNNSKHIGINRIK